MKKNYNISIALICVLLFTACSSSVSAQAQRAVRKFQKPIVKAFQRGSLLVSISEGSTSSVFTTKTTGATSGGSKSESPALVKRSLVEGCRDPLIIEYGISNHWGLGLSSGKDIFTINPGDFYGFTLSSNEPIQVSTNELTFDGNYHVFVNKRLDLSVFNSLGCFSVTFAGKDGDAAPYKYTANGNIIRLGTKVRYYFLRHFGAFGMASLYAGGTSPKDVKDNTVAGTYSTNVSGYAVEIGLCYRFIK